jgi:3-mercaptopyruvate sulfurtransferase SseA
MNGGRKAVLALVVVAITAGGLYLTNRAVTPREVTWHDVATEAQQGGYKLITTDELWERYQETPEALILVDTRQEWEYRAGHIEGAENFSMEPTWWSRWRKRAALESFLGPDKDRLIVFY